MRSPPASAPAAPAPPRASSFNPPPPIRPFPSRLCSARSVYTGSGSAYAQEPTAPQAQGEHRDLAFAQLHAATKTTPAQVPATWPVQDVTAQKA